MNMEIAQTIFTTIGISGLLIGAFTFLSKLAIEKFFDGKLESYKAELKQQNFKFEKIHEKQFEFLHNLVAILSSLLYDMKWRVNINFEPQKEDTSHIKRNFTGPLRTIVLNLERRLNEDGIFLDDNLLEKVKKIINDVNGHVIKDYSLAIQKAIDSDPETKMKGLEKKIQVIETINQDIALAIKDIRSEARKILYPS